MSASPLPSPAPALDSTAGSSAWWLRTAVLAFAISRIYILYGLEPAGSDLPYYALLAYRAVDQKLEGYKDFPVEYPPVAYWSIVLPRQMNVAVGRPVRSLEKIYKRYQSTFRSEAFLFDLWAFLLFLSMVNARRPTDVGPAAWGYVVVTGSLGHLLYDRLDIGLLFLLLLWVSCWLRADGEPRTSKRWVSVAGFVLGIGVAYKLIPILLFPLMAITEWRKRKDGGHPWLTVTTTVLGSMLPFLWYVPRSGMKVFDFLNYHSGRLVDVNSVYGTVLILLGPIVGHPVAKQEGASWDMVGPASQEITLVATAVLGLFLLGAATYLAFRRPPIERSDGYRLSIFVLPTSVLLAKVLSPQFLLFALPFAILAACESMKRSALLASVVLCSVIAGASTWIYPYHFFSHFTGGGVVVDDPWGVVPDFTPMGCLALIIRNGAFALLVAWLAISFGTRKESVK
ncbi:MAG: hypothetical protein U1D30_14175 [Planctomycetota bacterium]